MQTAKQAILARMKGEKADFIPEFYSVVKEIVYPGERFIDLKNFDPYGTGPDAWGVMWTNQETFGMYMEAVNEYGRQIEVK